MCTENTCAQRGIPKAEPAKGSNPARTDAEAEAAASQLLQEEHEAAESAQQAQQRAAELKRDRKARQKLRKQVGLEEKHG